jgi:hypothetical protein
MNNMKAIEQLARDVVGVEKFAWDTILEDDINELVIDYGIKSIVETGTWMGGTCRSFAGMVENVYTIEVNPDFYRQARTILSPLPNVKQFLGRANRMLPAILPMVQGPTLYYLDAHWHGSHPLPEELEAVIAHDPSPVIVMHDFQVPGHPELKFDPRPGGAPYCYEWIEPQLKKIKNPWRIFYNHEASGGCRVGVMFCVPVRGDE